MERINKGLNKRGIPEEAREWIVECINYNLPGGKQNRACAFLHSYHTLLSQEHHTRTAANEAFLCCMAWGIELLQAFFLIADDLMDHAVMRRGRKCWHRDPAIGLTALNDVLFLQTVLYCLLDDLILEHCTHSNKEKSYAVQKLFQEVTLKTEAGQFFDLKTLPPDQPSINMDIYTWERVHRIATLKTAYYSFYLPVALACILLDKEQALEEVEAALLPLGVFFQAQDDYLDVYGEVEKIGKVGTDIEEGKCSWLLLKALEVCTDEQKDIIKRSYGQKDEQSVRAVKDLFNQLDLPKHYHQYEQDFIQEYNQLSKPPALHPIISFFTNKIFHRQK